VADRMLLAEEVAGTLSAVGADSETPGRVRLTALEGKGDDATNILVTAGGGTPAPRERQAWDEIANEGPYRALSQWARHVGADGLSPILVDVAVALGVRKPWIFCPVSASTRAGIMLVKRGASIIKKLVEPAANFCDPDF